MRRGVPRLADVLDHVQRTVRVDDREAAERPVCNDSAVADELDRARSRRRRNPPHDPERTEIDHRETRLVVARHQRVGRASGGSQPGAQGEGRSGCERDEFAAVHEGGTAALALEVRVGTLNV
jgi:hypothetical protein